MEKKSISTILQISLIVVFVITALACASYQGITSVDGSKADGTVKTVYQTRKQFSQQALNEIQQISKEEACKRCRSWGFKDAEVLKGYNMTTNPFLVRTYKWKWQCIDK